MRKKILFGVLAAALVALNALAFSTPSSALPPEPPVTNGCYQTNSSKNHTDEKSLWVLY